jgi:hypothetical protein
MIGLEVESIAPPRPVSRRPHWDAGRGRLSLDGEVVRTFPPNARNVRCLLDAFEPRGWPDQVDNPLPQIKRDDPQSLHQAVKGLNRDQNRIRFGVGGGAAVVHWTLR